MSQPSPAWIARNLVRSSDRGVLATVFRKDEGAPYASLALAASDHQGAPLIYVSDLAEHTKNLKEDTRASFVFEKTAGLKDPLSGPRVTLQGNMILSDDPHLLERYFQHHSQARRYGQAHDFGLYRMEVKKVHLVAGFGSIHWIAASDYLYNTAESGELVEGEAGIVGHMNEDHSDAISTYAKHLLNADANNGWSMTGIDPEGIDMRREGDVLRMNFDNKVANPEQAREELIRILHAVRQK